MVASKSFEPQKSRRPPRHFEKVVKRSLHHNRIRTKTTPSFAKPDSTSPIACSGGRTDANQKQFGLLPSHPLAFSQQAHTSHCSLHSFRDHEPSHPPIHSWTDAPPALSSTVLSTGAAKCDRCRYIPKVYLRFISHHHLLAGPVMSCATGYSVCEKHNQNRFFVFTIAYSRLST